MVRGRDRVRLAIRNLAPLKDLALDHVAGGGVHLEVLPVREREACTRAAERPHAEEEKRIVLRLREQLRCDPFVPLGRPPRMRERETEVGVIVPVGVARRERDERRVDTVVVAEVDRAAQIQIVDVAAHPIDGSIEVEVHALVGEGGTEPFGIDLRARAGRDGEWDGEDESSHHESHGASVSECARWCGLPLRAMRSDVAPRSSACWRR